MKTEEKKSTEGASRQWTSMQENSHRKGGMDLAAFGNLLPGTEGLVGVFREHGAV